MTAQAILTSQQIDDLRSFLGVIQMAGDSVSGSVPAEELLYFRMIKSNVIACRKILEILEVSEISEVVDATEVSKCLRL